MSSKRISSHLRPFPNIDQLLRYGTVSKSVLDNYQELLQGEHDFSKNYPSQFSDFRKQYKEPREDDKKDGIRSYLYRHLYTMKSSPCFNTAVGEFWYLFSACLVYSRIMEAKTSKTFYSTINVIPSAEKSDKRQSNLAATVHQTYSKRDDRTGVQPGLDEYKTLKEENQRLQRMVEEHGQDIVKLEKREKESNMIIDDLRNRISGFASKQLTEGNPNFTDLSDKNRPTNLGQRFYAIYDDEWTTALEALTKKKSRKLLDDEAVFFLMNVLQEIYEFCVKIAESQFFNIVMNIVQPCVIDGAGGKKPLTPNEKIQREVTNIRRQFCEEPISNIIEKFKQTSKHLESYQEERDIVKYTEKCIEIIWLMRSHDPPMVLKWPKQGDKFDNNVYNSYLKKGDTVSFAVWPAVLLHEKGSVMHKGFAKPF